MINIKLAKKGAIVEHVAARLGFTKVQAACRSTQPCWAIFTLPYPCGGDENRLQGNWNGKPAVSKKGSAARAGPGSSTTSSGALKKLMILLLFLMVAGAVKAQGIAVSPDKLSFELFEGEQQQRQLTIFNTNPDKINFNINSSSALSFSQTEGTINAGEQQKITVTSGKLKPGSYNTELQISSEPQENSGISLNLGVAVKAMMLIKEKNPYKAIIGPLMTLTIVIVGLVAYMMFR